MSEESFRENYNIKNYDVPLFTVDMVIFTVEAQDLKVLLVQRTAAPFKNTWALPGGFCDLKVDTSIEDTAFRKLREKTGITSPYLEQVETIGNATRDPRGWAVTTLYFALIDFSAILNDGQSGSEPMQWVSVDEAQQMGLAFDHHVLLSRALGRLKTKTQYTSLPIGLMPDEFTLSELQSMYELILGGKVQSKSFRRRLEASDILKQTGEMRPTSRRPAALYRRSGSFENNYVFSGLLDSKPSNGG